MKLLSRDRPVAPEVTLTVNGQKITAGEGQTLAIVLLQNGLTGFNVNPVSGAERAPYCMMGACFECRMVVDGRRDVLTCRTLVRDGMVVEKQEYGDGML